MIRFLPLYSAPPCWKYVSTSGTSEMTVHQLPGVPVAVPGSATGSRSPNMRSYAASAGGDASERGTSRSRGIVFSGPRTGRARVYHAPRPCTDSAKRYATVVRSGQLRDLVGGVEIGAVDGVHERAVEAGVVIRADVFPDDLAGGRHLEHTAKQALVDERVAVRQPAHRAHERTEEVLPGNVSVLPHDF